MKQITIHYPSGTRTFRTENICRNSYGELIFTDAETKREITIKSDSYVIEPAIGMSEKEFCDMLQASLDMDCPRQTPKEIGEQELTAFWRAFEANQEAWYDNNMNGADRRADLSRTWDEVARTFVAITGWFPYLDDLGEIKFKRP